MWTTYVVDYFFNLILRTVFIDRRSKFDDFFSFYPFGKYTESVFQFKEVRPMFMSLNNIPRFRVH